MTIMRVIRPAPTAEEAPGPPLSRRRRVQPPPDLSTARARHRGNATPVDTKGRCPPGFGNLAQTARFPHSHRAPSASTRTREEDPQIRGLRTRWACNSGNPTSGATMRFPVTVSFGLTGTGESVAKMLVAVRHDGLDRWCGRGDSAGRVLAGARACQPVQFLPCFRGSCGLVVLPRTASCYGVR